MSGDIKRALTIDRVRKVEVTFNENGKQQTKVKWSEQVRTHKSLPEAGKEWTLFRHNDKFQRGDETPTKALSIHPLSVMDISFTTHSSTQTEPPLSWDSQPQLSSTEASNNAGSPSRPIWAGRAKDTNDTQGKNYANINLEENDDIANVTREFQTLLKDVDKGKTTNLSLQTNDGTAEKELINLQVDDVTSASETYEQDFPKSDDSTSTSTTVKKVIPNQHPPQPQKSLLPLKATHYQIEKVADKKQPTNRARHLKALLQESGSISSEDLQYMRQKMQKSHLAVQLER